MDSSNDSANLVPSMTLQNIPEGYLKMNALYQTEILQLKMKEVQTVKDLKVIIANAIFRPAKEIVLLYGGKLLLDEEQDLVNVGIANNSNIIVISTSDGGDCLKFTQGVLETMIKDLPYLKASLQSLVDARRLEAFISTRKVKAKNLKEAKSDLEDASEEGLVSIMLWTSSILFQRLNDVLGGSQDFSKWKVYLKTLLNGLKALPYFRGKVYHGWKNFKDLKTYQKGEIVIWKKFSDFSKNPEIAKGLSNANGTIFEAEVYSSRDISSVSEYTKEEGVLMLPYSCFEVINVIEAPGKPVIIKMREVPTPRTSKVVLWIDDNPERNYEIAQKIEQNDISCLFCVSTEDALRAIEKYRWLLFLENGDFKIITNMRRNENGVVNLQAGAELIEKLVQYFQYNSKILIFCEDIARAQEECNVRQLNGHFSITNDPKHILRFLNLH